MITFERDMPIIAALTLHPGARAVFERFGMGCSMCLGAGSETIEAGAIMHSVDPQEVVNELNRLDSQPAC